MKILRSLGFVSLLGAVLALAGCKAQEGAAEVPGGGLNAPPQAIADVAMVEMDTTANPIDVLANDLDPSGEGLTVTAVSVDLSVPPLDGSSVSTDGASVSFTPAAGFVGVVTLRYTVEDNAGQASSSVVAITVLPLVPPPVALPDVATVLQDSGATDVNVLANDIDFSGGGLTLTAASVTSSLPPATHGVAIVGNALRFTPAAGFVGVVAVGYTATDAGGHQGLGVLTVIVSPIQLPLGPVPVPDALAVTQDSGASTVDVLANDVDVAGGGLTLAAASVTASVPTAVHGVAILGNKLRFTPAAGFVGSVIVGYTAADTNGTQASGVLTVVVSPVPLTVGPVPVPDAAVLAQDSAATDIDVLANDVDPVGGGLTLGNVSLTASVPSATHALSIVGNKVRFAPAAGFAGSVVIGYTATDTNGTGAPGVLTVVVTPLGVSVGPIPVPDAATFAQDSGAHDVDVLANDVDPVAGGLVLSAPTLTASVPTAVHGLAVVGNKLRVTPAAGFAGSIVIGYTATDTAGGSASGVLTVVVTPLALSLGPVPVPDLLTVGQDSGATDAAVLANDIDSAGGGLTLSAASVTASVPTAVHGVSIVANKVRFTPAAGFAGAVVVGYTATDVNGNSASGVLNVVVSPVALAVGPVPLPDAATVAQNSSATDIDVLANDVNLIGGALTLGNLSVTASVPNATHTLAVVGNKVRFTPAAGFAGAVMVGYTATDGNGDSANGVLSITVSPLSLTPAFVAIPDAAVLAQDAPASDIGVLANDVDVAGGGLTLTGASVLSSLPTASHTVSVVGNKVRFTPAAGFAGVVVVTYSATDANGQAGSGLLDITVTPAALTLGPVAVPDVAVKSSSLGATSINVLANDVDPAGGGLTLTAVSIVTQIPSGAGTVSIVGNQVRYTPSALYIGAVTVSYTATDINGNTTIGELALTVTL